MSRPTTHHVGVTVSDLDRTAEFYREVLGLDELDRFTVSGPAFADAVDVDGATGRFVHLDGDGVRIELVEYDPQGPDAGGDEINRPGATHVAVAVDDLDAFHADLDSSVGTLSGPRTTESGTRILFLRDPEDNLVEVLET
jgi:catechol 2,3-dioxygenase-like lactoylglutathione lyase family enzyme